MMSQGAAAAGRRIDTFCDERQFWRKPFYMIGFLLEERVGYELGEVGILDAQLFETSVQVPLHMPNPSPHLTNENAAHLQDIHSTA